MPDKPILIFPAATTTARDSAGSGFLLPRPRPTRAQQATRLAARFQALTPIFGTVQTETDGIDPEQVIVLEVIGAIADFQNVVKKIPGMEWLGDFSTETEPDDPGFLTDGADAVQVNARLFVMAANRTAYNEVLTLWNQWVNAADEKLPRPYGRLAEAFRYLNDVRAWSPKDRVLATGVVAWWEERIAANAPSVRFEVELWCRSESRRRDAAFARLNSLIVEVGGQCINQAALVEIDYHGVLVELPGAAVREVVQALNAGTDTQLLRLTDVRQFSPVGEAAITPIEEGSELTPPTRPLPTGDPVVALLDGVPLANHAALRNRLVIDDPDNLAAQYRAGEQRHGTAMASLIVHDEYDGTEPALSRRIYVRPVMVPGRADLGGKRHETFPPDELPVDLIHRAVRRMFEAEGDSDPVAPSIRVINLSLGDTSQLFDRQLSPWARLLDWLSWKYGVLFIVSAGNHLSDLPIPSPPASISSMSDDDLRAHTLRAMGHQRLERRLLAPAESLNALTVGALHAQSAPVGPTGNLVDLLRAASLPSPVSSVATGFRRAVKPEILVRGGRRHYAPKLQPGGASNAIFQISSAVAQPGQLVAACHPTGLSDQHTTRTSGSSNAAALTTRQAALSIQRIESLRAEAGGDQLTDAMLPVLVKAMLVHGASWGEWLDVFGNVFDFPESGLERWWAIRRACAQFLGYGPVDFSIGSLCTDQRVTVLGCNELRAEEAHLYDIPLPPALNAQRVLRRLTITLAWISPINPRHRNYRAAHLWFDAPYPQLRVKRQNADHDAVTRGTVQHEVLEGSDAVPITGETTLPIQVNCRPDAVSRFPDSVRYALLVSLETAEPLAVSIYDQVKAKLDALRLPAPVAVRAGARRQNH